MDALVLEPRHSFINAWRSGTSLCLSDETSLVPQQFVIPSAYAPFFCIYKVILKQISIN